MMLALSPHTVISLLATLLVTKPYPEITIFLPPTKDVVTVPEIDGAVFHATVTVGGVTKA